MGLLLNLTKLLPRMEWTRNSSAGLKVYVLNGRVRTLCEFYISISSFNEANESLAH